MIAAALAAVAIVTQDAAALRSQPRDSGMAQAQLTQGDTLEVRGERMDYLQVYDHRRERAGYVRASQVRLTQAGAADAPELLSVLRFVRDTPGQEALGVGYAAVYLKAVPVQAITAEPFDALGTMAERLARRASARAAAPGADNRLAAQLEGVASYGVRILSHEHDGTVRLCYDGEAFRRVLSMPSATPAQRARAVLGLTRHDCVDPALRANETAEMTRWRADLVQRLGDTDMAQLPEQLKNRIHLRRAGVQALLAFEQARRGESGLSAGRIALQALAAVNKAELSDDDQAEYNDAAIRVGASRWAAEAPVEGTKPVADRPALLVQPGQPGQTCVLLTDAQHDSTRPLLRQCTWGVAWLASARVHPSGQAVALAVQPLGTWRELWLMRKTPAGWALDVLPPAPGNPLGEDTGYLEFAGWVPEGEPRLLLAREARLDGRFMRRFEVSRLDSLAVDKQASSPQGLALFQRWQDPAWKRQSVALR